jgi:serine protease Do
MTRVAYRQGWLWVVVLALAVSLGLSLSLHQSAVVGQDAAGAIAKSDTVAPAKTPEQLRNDPNTAHAKALSQAFREAASAATPSVVTVYAHETAKKVKSTRGDNPFKNNPMFRGGDNPFKGTPFEDMFPNGGEGQDFSWQTPPREGMGSGVIIDKSGIVLTNNHVVEGADSVTVHMSDGREFKATEIKTDPHSDLAVVRIKPEGDLPAAHLGNSDDLEIGDWVIAIGQPFEQENSVTAGIISGKGRELGSVQRTKFLQTDAAINPGNSGGPLVNLDGEVVGINTAIASNSGGYQGIGFAIPINQAKWVTEQLIKNGSVSRGYLGVGIGEVNSELAAKFGVKKGEGVLVSEVYPNTPAANAKIQEGDVILKFNGKAVHTPRDIQELVERSPLNTAEPVEVLRDGKPMTLNVTVKALPDDFGAREHDTGKPLKKAPPAEVYGADELGLEVANPSAEEADAYNGYEGVIVRKVEPDGIAAAKGLRPGMLVRKVGKTTVKNVHDFEAALKHETVKDGVLFQLRTPVGNRFIVLQAQ